MALTLNGSMDFMQGKVKYVGFYARKLYRRIYYRFSVTRGDNMIFTPNHISPNHRIFMKHTYFRIEHTYKSAHIIQLHLQCIPIYT